MTSPNMYTWDYAGRLTSALGNSFTYDYLGRRTTSAVGNTTTRYISFEQHTVSERNTTLGVSTDYVFGPGIDEPLAKRTADGAISYYGADGLGSVVLVTDANASVTGSAAYDPWGTRGGGSELFGYTGRESGGPFWFYRARYYDSGSGRFISEDPIGFDGGRNYYAYANGNPVLLRDPFGLAVWICSRKTVIGWGNHAYLWDDRRDTLPDQRSCGRGNNSGHETGPQAPGMGPGSGDQCNKVAGSGGHEDDIMGCCRTNHDKTHFFLPPFNDCQTYVDDCVEKANLKSPGAPGGRVGPPCCAIRTPGGRP